MSDIRVNADSIDRYGDVATECFGGVQGALQVLVDAIAHVNYQGENAEAFKRQCGDLSIKFADGIHKNMVAMTNSVNAATTAVSNSLGGRNVSVTVAAKAVTPTEGQKADSGTVQVNLPALEALQEVVNSQFKAVTDQLGTHQTTLGSTDWTGTSKDRAVGEVGKLTTSAMEQCTEANKQINTYITTQVNNVRTSDV